MRDGVGLIADEVVEPVRGIRINKTITDPLASPDTEGRSAAVDCHRFGTTHVSLMSVMTSKAASTPSSSTVPSCTAAT